MATVGVSLTFVMVRSNVSAVLNPALSVPVTFRLTIPTCGSSGVPLNVRVVALNANHPGRALPSPFVALNVSVSPIVVSGSVKVFAGTAKVNCESSAVL